MTETDRLRAALAEIRILASDQFGDGCDEIAAIATAALAPPQPTPDTRPVLTERQAEVLAFIRESIASRGYGPTVREIANAQQVNLNAIQGHLKALRRKGYLAHTPKVCRTLSVVEAT